MFFPIIKKKTIPGTQTSHRDIAAFSQRSDAYSLDAVLL